MTDHAGLSGVRESSMKIDRHYHTAALAAAFLLGVASAGCTSSYSVEVPASAPSAGVPAADIPALTQSVNWDKIPVAAMTEGF
jgi:hypothetical protein